MIHEFSFRWPSGARVTVGRTAEWNQSAVCGISVTCGVLRHLREWDEHVAVEEGKGLRDDLFEVFNDTGCQGVLSLKYRLRDQPPGLGEAVGHAASVPGEGVRGRWRGRGMTTAFGPNAFRKGDLYIAFVGWAVGRT